VWPTALTCDESPRFARTSHAIALEEEFDRHSSLTREFGPEILSYLASGFRLSITRVVC